jgi:hypothetical protein
MREIKFRGFNRKNDVWLYGFYLQNRGAHFIAPDEFATGKSWDDYEITPDTLGQYLGHHDDCDFYEGDIVEDEWGCRYSIEWLEDTQSFCLYEVQTGYTPMDGRWLTVIGNIFDNFELLQKF